jgi:hypothetical protein
VAAVGLLVVGGGTARAQLPGRVSGLTPYTQPAYSPYLNLFRAGNPVFANYYGLVRPEVEFRTGIRGLQQQAAAEQDLITGQMGAALPATGHRTTFMNTGGYFLNRVGGGAAGARPAGQTATLGQPVAPRR